MVVLGEQLTLVVVDDVDVGEVGEVVDVGDGDGGVALVSVDGRHVDVLAVGVDRPGLPVVAHDLVDVARQVRHPLLTPACRLLTRLLVLLVVDRVQLLQVGGVLNHLHEALPAGRAQNLLVFARHYFLESDFARVAEELL